MSQNAILAPALTFALTSLDAQLALLTMYGRLASVVLDGEQVTPELLDVIRAQVLENASRRADLVEMRPKLVNWQRQAGGQ